MQNRNTRRSAIKNILSPLRAAAVALLLVVPLAWPAAGEAQEVSGEASAVRARLLGATTVLSDTGMLSDSSDAREASQLTGGVSSMLTGEALHAAAIGYPDAVDSEASLGNLNLTVAGYGIRADLVMARAFAIPNATGEGLTNILSGARDV